VLLGNENRVLLILPLNVAAVMPPELEFFSPIVWKEMEIYLRAQDKQLKTISRQAARNLWVQSIRKVRSAEEGARAGFDDAARALVAELRNHAEFDAMIAPSLFVREAAVSERSAHWDGVKRGLEVEARGLEARRLASQPLEGVVPAASIHVAVFDARGEKIHDGLGGLEPLVGVRVVGNSDSGQPIFRFATRAGLFENEEHVREGLGVAFSPFLPPLAE
jgi:hypothetical protein